MLAQDPVPQSRRPRATVVLAALAVLASQASARASAGDGVRTPAEAALAPLPPRTQAKPEQKPAGKSADKTADKGARKPPADPPRDAAAEAEAARRAQCASALDKAFTSGDAADRQLAIENAAPVLDAALVGKVAKGLGDKTPAVQRAAIEALRFARLPEAVRALREAVRLEPALRKDPEMHAALLRAIAQNGAPEAIATLTDEMWADTDPRVLQARFFGLGRVRTRAALEALIAILRTTSASKLEPHMEHVRTSLMVLTGVDQGTSIDAWLRWWNESGARVTLTEKPAPLPQRLQSAWEAYWGESRPDPRPVKRADRGRGDPEGPARR